MHIWIFFNTQESACAKIFFFLGHYSRITCIPVGLGRGGAAVERCCTNVGTCTPCTVVLYSMTRLTRQLPRRIFLIMAFHGVVVSPVEMTLLDIDGATHRVLYGSHDPVHCPWDTIVHELVAMHLPPFMHTQEAIVQTLARMQAPCLGCFQTLERYSVDSCRVACGQMWL